MIITATKFTLKSWKLYGEFFIDTYHVAKQVRRANGIMRVKIHPVSLRTLTVWQNREDMVAFRNSGAHLRAMKKSQYFGAIESFTWESTEVPSWKEASRRLDESAH